jgi:hypothetical protein
VLLGLFSRYKHRQIFLAQNGKNVGCPFDGIVCHTPPFWSLVALAEVIRGEGEIDVLIVYILCLCEIFEV